MVEINYKTVAGFIGLLALVTLSATSVFYLEKTTQYKSCQGSWVLQDDGQYQCSKNLEKFFCYSIEPRGSGWNRCWIVTVFNAEVPIEEVGSLIVDCNGKMWVSEGNKPYSKMKSDNSVAYYGEC